MDLLVVDSAPSRGDVIAGDRLLSRFGRYKWLAYDYHGETWAAAYVDGELVTFGHDWKPYVQKQDGVEYLTDADITAIASAWPDQAGLPILPSQDGVGLEPAEKARDDLLRRWTMPELLAEPDQFEWIVAGMLAFPTYGQLAGEMKTLKSYLKTFVEIGLASGTPIFGQFRPLVPAPVVAYVGEGGRIPWTRRTRRVAAAMGVNPTDLDLHPVFDIAPIASETFQTSLARDLHDLEPALVTLDPLYTYHGLANKASNLHEEGALLNLMSAPITDANSSLLVVNHFNQTGAGQSLKRITMAGSGEWADSWVLVSHREDPDVTNGSFRLALDIGSRQWGGTSWHLDLNIGRFDQDTGTHDGDITWDLRPAAPASTADAGRDGKDDRKVLDARHAISEIVADRPWRLTKSEVKERVGGSRSVFATAFNSLVDDGLIRHDQLSRDEAGTTKTRPLWGPTTNMADPDTAHVPPLTLMKEA